jgi:hypothetical protein
VRLSPPPFAVRLSNHELARLVLLASLVLAALVAGLTASPAQAQPSSCPANPSPPNAADPSMVVASPQPGERVSSPMQVSGRARVFEANVRLTLFDARGQVLVDTFTTAAEAGPALAPFATNVRFSTAQEQAGCLRVFEASARDGSPVNVVQVPLLLSPTIVAPRTGDAGLRAHEGAFGVSEAALLLVLALPVLLGLMAVTARPRRKAGLGGEGLS